LSIICVDGGDLTEDIAERASSRWRLGATAAAIVLSLLVRIPWLGGPVTPDESGAMTVARELLHGELPHVTAWQQRHPGTYVFYVAALLLPASPDTQRDILGAVAVACTIAGLAACLFALCSRYTATFGVLIYGLASADPSLHGYTTNTETLINALLVWSVAMVARWCRGHGSLAGLVGAGLLAGASGTIKEHTVLFVAFIALTLVWPADGARPRWKPAFAFCAAAGIPWLLIVLIYAAAGELPILIDTFAFNAGHVRLRITDLAAGPLLLATRTYAAFGTWPLWILGACWLGVWLSRKGAERTAVAYLAAAVGMIVLPGYFFEHYYLLALPPLVMASACFLDVVRAASRPRSIALAAFATAYVAAMQLAFIAGHIPLEVRKFTTTDRYTENQRRFSAALAENCAGATLVVYGLDNQFHFYSRLRPAQPILFLPSFDRRWVTRPDPAAKAFLDLSLRALQRRAPDVVILQEPVSRDDARPVARRIAQLLSRGYTPLPLRDVSGNLGFDSYADLRAVAGYRRIGAAHDCRQLQLR